MDRFFALFRKDWFLVLLIVAISVPAFSALVFKGYFPHHDDLQFMRIYEIERCFSDGQIPCRWVPDMGYGYGYPLFNFYPPLPFYTGAAIQTFSHLQIIDTVKILFILQFLIGSTLMYLFARQWWGRLGGIVSAVFFTYAPYHAVDLYVRGALNEAWAIAFAPGVAWAMTRLSKNPTVTNSILLSAFFSGMLLSHNLMVLIFTPLFAVFALILLFSTRSIRYLIHLILSGVITFGLCAFFSIPVLLEQKYAHVDTLFSGYFNYTVHFVTLHQLFLTRFWGFGGSVYGPYDGLAFPVGWLHWIMVIIVMLTSLYFLWKRQMRIFSIIVLFAGYFWFSAFLTHEKSTPIWLHIKILQELQFPWRFLSTVMFCASFLVGALFLLPIKQSAKLALGISLIVGVVALNVTFFHTEYTQHITDAEKSTGTLWQLQQTAGIFDYLPIYAVAPPGRAANGLYQIVSGSPLITSAISGSDWTKITYTSSNAATLRLNTFDFPRWQVTLDGKKIPLNHDNYLGLITFQIPPGEHHITAQLTNTPLRSITNLISAATFILIAVFFGRAIYMRYKKRLQPATSSIG